MQKIVFQDATVVKAPYVEINGVEYPVIFETEGGTDLDAETFNTMEDYIEEAIEEAGTTDYEDLENKPQINSVELIGNKSLDDLGIASKVNLDNLRNISYQEKIVGYWTDGAPIYRKKIDINQTLNTGVNSISHGVDFRKDGYVKVEGSVIYGNNAYQIPTFANTTSFLEVNAVTPTNIELMLGSGWNGLFKNGYLDFYYMKKADRPQS